MNIYLLNTIVFISMKLKYIKIDCINTKILRFALKVQVHFTLKCEVEIKR